MKFLTQQLKVLVAGTTFAFTKRLSIIGAEPGGDEFHILCIHDTTGVIGGCALDPIDIVLPSVVDSIPVHLHDLLHDICFHHFSTVQTQTSIVHCEENRMRLVLGWRINFEK